MKTLWIAGMTFLAVVSCKDMQQENKEITSKESVLDSMKLVMEKQRIIDSVKMAESTKKRSGCGKQHCASGSCSPAQKDEWCR